MVDNMSLNKSEQVLLLVLHHVLRAGKGAEKVNFTVRSIADRYGKELVNWETAKSDITKLISARFYALTNDNYIKVIGKNNDRSNIYRITSERPTDLFHQLMEKLKCTSRSNKGRILSESLESKLILYNDEGIFESSEGHYRTLDRLQSVFYIQKLLNVKQEKIS